MAILVNRCLYHNILQMVLKNKTLLKQFDINPQNTTVYTKNSFRINEQNYEY